MFDWNEFKTRIEKIDVLLKEQGWNVKDRTKVLVEVDTKQSDFKARNYKTVSETLRNKEESKYVDYLLLDDNGEALAILEAKRTSKDPIATAQKQAEQYADDIKKQTGKDIFIFLSNGYEIWFWNRPHQGPRLVRGFYSRKDLDRVKFQNKNKQILKDFEIDTKIIDRLKSLECSKRVIERLDKGHRKALIVMATGTGKTRVAMAIIDVLMRANHAQKVLFLADRKALRDQAYSKGFKQFFPEEAKSKIFSGKIDKTSRLYVSTIQTFMECYQEISPGYFDVIISDEAHRSIYDKWKEVFTYFDAIQIGLTATPSELIERDTFRFFGCGNKQATAMYDYYDAVKDKVLCDFKVHAAQAHFQIEGVTQHDVSREELKKLLEKGINPEEIKFEGTQFEKKFVTKGTNEAIAKEFYDHCLMDETGTIPAKTIFFAISKKHAKRLWEAFEKLYPEYKGRLCRIIISDDTRAQDSIKEFQEKPWPRIAISVDMLDTGVDIPEVCNLVFAKPVFSKIKFWQMIGRGTRADITCFHKHWLPNGEKDYFKIFDFWKNFEYFDMKPEGDQKETGEAITNRIFRLRLLQLSYFQKKKEKEKAELIKKKLLDDINSLPLKSVSIREHMRDVEKALSPQLWDNIGVEPLEFLKKKIAPLMRFKQNVNYNIASFILKVERLRIAILGGNDLEKKRLQKDIGKALDCLPRNLQVVKKKEVLLDSVLSKKFWKSISFDGTQVLLDEFADLMRYKREEPKEPIIIDIDDIIEERKIVEFGPNAMHEHVKVYKEKIEKRIKRLAKKHPTIQKIMKNQILTESDLKKLEDTLNSPELYFTEDVLKQLYEGTFVQFIKHILGLYKEEKPEEKIREAFETLLVENNKHYNADQFNFIRTIESVFAKKKHIEFSDFFEPPFTNFGINAPIPMFEETELNQMVDLCNGLEHDLFGQQPPGVAMM